MGHKLLTNLKFVEPIPLQKIINLSRTNLKVTDQTKHKMILKSK
jgi:hypothetical protein